MIVNCFYDEDMAYADIVYIPDLGLNIDTIQNYFYKWLFDKTVNHKYWIIVDGEKKACKYGTDAFIDWINNTYLSDKTDKAKIIKSNAETWNSTDNHLIF